MLFNVILYIYLFPPHHPAATILVERFELGKGLSQCEPQSRSTPHSVWFYIEYCQKGPPAKIVAFSKSHYKSGSSSHPGRGPPNLERNRAGNILIYLSTMIPG